MRLTEAERKHPWCRNTCYYREIMDCGAQCYLAEQRKERELERRAALAATPQWDGDR